MQRILRGVAATLSVTLTDGDGTAAAASGAVTVGVIRADGTVLVAAGTATANPSTGVYTVGLTPAQNAALDLLTATWTDAGDGSVHTSLHEVVGGFLFSVAEARDLEPTLADTSAYPTAKILQVRTEVEQECEAICDVAFVPRYRRARVDGTGGVELLLPDHEIRTVRSVRTYADSDTYAALTSAQLAELLVFPDDRRIERPATAAFDLGRLNVVVEYEHGYDAPPPDLKRANVRHLRHRLNAGKSGIPDRANRLTTNQGVTYDLERPGPFSTGIPDVDAVYQRYSKRSGDGDEDGTGGAVRPRSRSFDLDPQRGSLFHGGRR